jgi:hypothetical protein
MKKEKIKKEIIIKDKIKKTKDIIQIIFDRNPKNLIIFI